MFLGQTNTPSTANKKKHANISEEQLNSNQQVVPVKWFLGRRYIAADFLSPCYNQVNKPVEAQTGKDESSTVAHIYFADFALIWAVCGRRRPLDAVFKVIIDYEIHWENSNGLFFGGADYVDITTKRGTLRLRAGNGTQAVDTLIFGTRGAIPIDPSFKLRDKSTWPEDNSAGKGDPLGGHYDRHGAYHYQSYSTHKKWRLGREKTQVAQWMMELQRSAPWFAGSAVDRGEMGLDSDARGVNPIAAIYELFTDDVFGRGYTDAQLRQAGWEAALEQFKDFRISPFMTQQEDAKTIATRLLEYVDGYVRDYDGLLDIGFWDHGPIDLDSLPVLTDEDLDGTPEIEPGDLEELEQTTIVTFNDRAHHYQDRPAKSDDPAIRKLQGQTLPPVIEDRKFITDATLAKKYAAEFQSIKRALPQSGPIFVKREWIDNAPRFDGGGDYGQVREGDRVVWQTDRYGVQEVIRVNEIEWPEDRSGQAKLEVEYDRAGNTQQQYIAPPPVLPGDFLIEPVAISNKRIIELPSGLKTLAAPQIAVLSQRPRVEVIGFAVHASVDNTTFDQVAAANRFAAFGKVAAAAYPNNTADVDTATGITVDLFGIDLDSVVSQTDSQRDDNAFLLFVDNEIMSVGAVTALGAGRYNIKLKRKLYGTAKANHFIDADCWFIPRAFLTPIDNKNFLPGATRYFKLQPYTDIDQLDIAGISSVAYNFVNAPAVGSVFNVALETSSGVSADNNAEVHIYAHWESLLDQDIFLFEVAWKKATDTAWLSQQVYDNDATFPVAPATLYNVRVRPFNTHGEDGPWTDPVQITSGKLASFMVTGLELVGQGNDTIFQSRDAKFECRLNSPSAVQAPGSGPLTPGAADPLFDSFEWTVWNGDQRVWRELTKDPQFNFTFEKNIQAGGPFATFRLEVRVIDRLGEVSLPALLTVNNPAPEPPQNAALFPTTTGVNIQWTNPTAPDLDHVEILMSEDPFDQAPALVGKVATPGTDFVFNRTNNTGATEYFWLVEVDTFGNKSVALFTGESVQGQVVGDVVINPSGGTITEPTAIALSCRSTPSAPIYWRNDATTPTSADNLYNPAAPPIVGESGSFSAVAKLGGVYGNVTRVDFTFDAGACAAPTFNPTGGSFTNPAGTKDVEISTVTDADEIRFTTDGSEPTSSHGTSISGSSGIATLPTGVTTLKARTIKSGLTDSSVTTATFTVIQSGGGGSGGTGGSTAVADPEFAPRGGSSHVGSGTSGRPIVFGTRTQKAVQRYTSNGSAPTSGSSGHGTPTTINVERIVVSVGVSVRKAIAYQTGLPDSGITTETYTVDNASDTAAVKTPEMVPSSLAYSWADLPRTVRNIAAVDDPPEYVYSRKLNLGLACETPNTKLRWTKNGTTPTAGSAGTGTLIASAADLITLSFDEGSLPASVTIKVIAYRTGSDFSAVATFVINFTA